MIMSYGKMNTFIDIVEKVTVKDQEGFRTEVDNIVASVRAYREGRHGNEKWANRAVFSEATDLFRFRLIPGVTVNTTMIIICGDSRLRLHLSRMSQDEGCTLRFWQKR
jgi:head-tail adaptor